MEDSSQPGRLLGLIIDGDLRRDMRDHDSEAWSVLTAKDLMTVDPITVSSDLLAVEAIQRMEHNRRKPISVLPVVDEQKSLLGLLRLHYLVQAGITTHRV